MIKKSSKVLLILLSIVFLISTPTLVDALTVTLTSPANNDTVTSTKPSFKFRAEEFNESAGIICNLMIDDSNSGAKEIFDNGVYTIKPDTALKNGTTHRWTVNCAGASAPATWVFHIRVGNLWDGLEDFGGIMSGLLGLALGSDEDNREQGFIRLMLFLVIFGVVVLAAGKALGNFDSGGTTKAVAVVIGFVLAVLGARAAPDRMIEIMLDQLGAYMSMLMVIGPAALVLFVMFTITSNPYIRGIGLIVAGIFFPSENLIDMEFPAAIATKVILILGGIGIMVHGAHSAGRLKGKGGDVKRLFKGGVKKTKDFSKLIKNWKRERRINTKEDLEIKELEVKGREVMKEAKQLAKDLAQKRGMSKSTFRKRSKKIEKELEKEKHTARKLLKNLNSEFKRIRQEASLVNKAGKMDVREIRILKTDRQALESVVKKRYNIGKMTQSDIAELKELRRIHGEINKITGGLTAEYNTLKKAYGEIVRLDAKAKKVFATENSNQVYHFLRELIHSEIYLENLERVAEKLGNDRTALASLLDDSAKRLKKFDRRERRAEKVVKREVGKAMKGKGNIGLKATG